jgi:flagellar basal-body rod protein FlgB
LQFKQGSLIGEGGKEQGSGSEAKTMFGSTTIPVLEQVVNFAQARHGLLAGNIANIDTPGYRARDLSPEKFQARLRDAIDVRDRQGMPLSPGEVMAGRTDPVAEAGDDLKGILYHDDSDGGLEQQISEITKNQQQHNLALSILTQQFRQLQAAISERAA